MAFLPLMMLTCVAAVAVMWVIFAITKRMDRQRENDKRSFDLVHKALDSGAIDAETKAMLVRVVAERGAAQVSPMFAVGWIGLFVGGAMIAAGSMTYEARDVLPAGIVVAVVSFGVLSMPIAAREMLYRGGRGASRETMLGNPDARR